ncbi:lymphocyte antigen 6 complex locus protein G6d [Kryptolebias marmoratus]|uniref:lymphocyte antigen 6 complex locus protein G6d n=1 Tax=Kryptolebias marmoratus TaxID=37003 RepID=UPI0007F8ADBD|nr:lymphocyte antigen 6 complex locus protein G6d [Kryptolebias marmoratus]
MKTLLICGALMVMIVTGESLTCQTCRSVFKDRCFYSSSVSCSHPQSSCYNGKLAFNISSLITLYSRSCLPSSLCNQTETGTLLTVGYTVTRTCCGTDDCNGATSVRLSTAAALAAAVTAAWSLVAF